jgi:Ca2+-binding RTX toxin-like protein
MAFNRDSKNNRTELNLNSKSLLDSNYESKVIDKNRLQEKLEKEKRDKDKGDEKELPPVAVSDDKNFFDVHSVDGENNILIDLLENDYDPNQDDFYLLGVQNITVNGEVVDSSQLNINDYVYLQDGQLVVNTELFNLLNLSINIQEMVQVSFEYAIMDSTGLHDISTANLNFYPDNYYEGLSVHGTYKDEDMILTNNDDIVYSYQGNDYIAAYAGDDIVYSGLGNDVVNLGNDNDLAYLGDGDDFADGGAGKDIIYGELGNDEIFGHDGNDFIYGGFGLDKIWGGEDDDTIYGENGWDDLFGGSGNDNIYGGGGNDEIWGGEDDDTIHGEGGWDDLFGGSGNDNIYGGFGHDNIYGGSGNDNIYGGSLRDWIQGGAGGDHIDGGDGIDFADYVESNGFVHVDLLMNTASGHHAEGDTLDNIENLNGSNFNDQLHGDSGANILYGNDGDDIISGKGGNDEIYGGEGDDLVIGGEGNADLYGGNGYDIVDFSGFSNSDNTFNSVYGSVNGFAEFYGISIEVTGIGVNQITGKYSYNSHQWHPNQDFDGRTAGFEKIIASDYNDILILGGDIYGVNGTLLDISDANNTNVVHAMGGDDWINGAGAYTIYAGEGNDYIRVHGTPEDEFNENFIFGGEGDDVIHSSFRGVDTISGGEGNDIFVFDLYPYYSNTSIITDFEQGSDKIYIYEEFFGDYDNMVINQIDGVTSISSDYIYALWGQPLDIELTGDYDLTSDDFVFFTI